MTQLSSTATSLAASSSSTSLGLKRSRTRSRATSPSGSGGGHGDGSGELSGGDSYDEESPPIVRPVLDPELFEYYLHYVDFDRRLDAWVSFGELVDVDTSEGRQATAARKAAKQEVPNPLTKQRDHSHGGMLNEAAAAFEREHEELTKVKNLDTVDFGSYRMEAWYYSPYPVQYVCPSWMRMCISCSSFTPSARALSLCV